MERSPSARARRDSRRARDLRDCSEVTSPAALKEKLADRYANLISVVCLGGMLMGFLLAATLAVNRTLFPGPPEILELILVPLISGMVGVVFGLALGLAEGLILVLLLESFLERFGNEG